MKKFERVLGSAERFGDSRWHAGLFKEGNCLSWTSFSSRGEAERWLENPSVPSSKSAQKFSSN
jgi:hypothetical protein